MEKAMREKQVSALGDMFGKDLAGYQIAYGYCLLRDHGLMATSPALIADTREVVICLEQQTIQSVKKLLTPSPSKIRELTLLYNSKEGIGFCLNSERLYEMEAVRVFTDSECQSLISRHKEPFRWSM